MHLDIYSKAYILREKKIQILTPKLHFERRKRRKANYVSWVVSKLRHLLTNCNLEQQRFNKFSRSERSAG